MGENPFLGPFSKSSIRRWMGALIVDDGLPTGERYVEVFNSDSAHYRGSNLGNDGIIVPEPLPWMGLGYSAAITLPPLAGLLLKPEP